MYRGTKRFDREQLVFIVDAALSAAFDKVQGALPCQGEQKIIGFELDRWCQNRTTTMSFVWGAVHQVGIFIPILWAQTEGKRVGDGMGTEDFEGWTEFEKMVQDYIFHNTTQNNKPSDPPDTRPLAEKIVDSAWGDYLKNQTRPRDLFEAFNQGDLFEEMQNQGVHPDNINGLADDMVAKVLQIIQNRVDSSDIEGTPEGMAEEIFNVFGVCSSDQYIEEVPSFETMYQVRKEIDDLIEAMESLYQGDDVVQRATDLDTMAQSLYESVRRMVTVTD